MKTEEQIKREIDYESHMLEKQKGHNASITRGYLMALEWVLEKGE